MFEFHWPWAALLLLLPFLLPRLWPERQVREEETLEGQRLTLLHPAPCQPFLFLFSVPAPLVLSCLLRA